MEPFCFAPANGLFNLFHTLIRSTRNPFSYLYSFYYLSELLRFRNQPDLLYSIHNPDRYLLSYRTIYKLYPDCPLFSEEMIKFCNK